jgi:hypothetical protein
MTNGRKKEREGMIILPTTQMRREKNVEKFCPENL